MFASPLLVFAAPQNLQDLIKLIIDILNSVVPVIIGLAMITFLWGVFSYIVASGEEDKLVAAKNTIVWGLLGLFVMLSVWGLVGLLTQSVFGTSPSTTGTTNYGSSQFNSASTNNTVQQYDSATQRNTPGTINTTTGGINI